MLLKFRRLLIIFQSDWVVIGNNFWICMGKFAKKQLLFS